MESTPDPSPTVRAAIDDALVAVEALRRAEARVLVLVDELDRLGAARDAGYATTERLLKDLARVDPSEARSLVRQAAVVVERPGLSGEPVPPALPATGDALQVGAIGRAHLDVVMAAMQRVARMAHLPVAVVDETERQLAVLARLRTPRELAREADEILRRLDPDGELDDEPARPDQELHLSSGRDGSLRGRFRFADPDAAETVRTAIDALTPPPDGDVEAGTFGRSLPERQADALRDLAADALGTADTEDGDSSTRTQGGDAVGLIVTVPLDVLEARARERLGYGLLDGQWAVGPETARRLACDAAVVPAVLGSRGEVLDLGRKTRVVSTAQRRALIARDRHCAHPGCRRRPRRCRAHHIIPWAWGGATDLSNLVLLCAHHHHVVHHSGWSIHMRDGIPTFVPPAWLDPVRTPQGA